MRNPRQVAMKVWTNGYSNAFAYLISVKEKNRKHGEAKPKPPRPIIELKPGNRLPGL
jgi:hypothetical protein